MIYFAAAKPGQGWEEEVYVLNEGEVEKLLQTREVRGFGVLKDLIEKTMPSECRTDGTTTSRGERSAVDGHRGIRPEIKTCFEDWGGSLLASVSIVHAGWKMSLAYERRRH